MQGSARSASRSHRRSVQWAGGGWKPKVGQHHPCRQGVPLCISSDVLNRKEGDAKCVIAKLCITYSKMAVGCLCRRPCCCCMTRLSWRKPFCCAHPPPSLLSHLPPLCRAAVGLSHCRLWKLRCHKSHGEAETDSIAWGCERDRGVEDMTDNYIWIYITHTKGMIHL